MIGRRWIRYAGLLLVIAVLPVAWNVGSNWLRQSRTASELAKCRELRVQRKWPELAERARLWSEWSPKDADGWLFRAEAAQSVGDFTQATEFLAQVDEASPKYLPSQLARAELMLGSGNRPLDGERVCRLILDKEPRATKPHQWLIQYYAMTLQKQKLLAQIREAIRVHREPPEAYLFAFSIDALRLTAAVEVNSRWLEAHPNEEVFLVSQALNSVEPASEPDPISESDPLTAVRVDSLERQSREARLRALLKQFPQNIELLAHHIEWAIAEGNLESVVRLLQDAPAAADADNRFWRFRGWVQVQSGELDAARQSYDQALAIAPLDWVTRNRLVTLLRLRNDVGQIEKQLAIVDKARALRARLKSITVADPVTKDLIRDFRDYADLCGDSTFSQVAESVAPSKGGGQ
ncbi:MAG: hypothetical protein AABP62_17435 [Planctomycetota bacterium]